MILSDTDILSRLETGDLVIEPLSDVDLQVQPASVDLRLGREFLEFQHANIPCIHPNEESEVAEYVSETVVDEGGEFILHPGDFVLGTTVERVEIPDDIIAHVEGRSSLGRLAIVVHASLPYDEQVFLWTPEEGFGYYEIGDVVENERPARAVAFDPRTLEVGTYTVTGHIRNPRQRIYEVTLDSGRTVRVTKDHNLFTLDGMGRVTRLPSEEAEGTRVMIPGTLPGSPTEVRELDLLDHVDPTETTLYAADGSGAVDWKEVARGCRNHYRRNGSAPMTAVPRASTPEDVEVAFKQSTTRLPRRIRLTPEFGWVLGFYIAEGSARRKQIQVSNTECEYLDRFAAFFESFDTSLSWHETENIDRLTVCSALWSKLFRELAGEGGEKNVPEGAMNWPEEVLAAMLEGLLDGDGCRRDERETLYSKNPALVDRVMYLAARLGRLGSAYSREREIHIPMSDTDWSGEMWAVDVSGERHKRGQYVPVPNELLRSLRDEAGMSLAAAAEDMGYRSKSSITNVEKAHYDGVKRETLERFRDAYEAEGADVSRLDQILDGGIRFEEVVSVEETNCVEPTYDLEVQPGGRTIENFIGGRGGVFLSNTAGLCDPGYRGQITLELSNLGRAPVALSPGMRISQLTFTELKNPAERPYGSKRGSKYQDQAGPQASRIGGDSEFGGDQ
jgi:dCTP deaminase